MAIIDSNILIYAIQPQYQNLRELLFSEPHCISEITRLEVLGYHKLSKEDQSDLELMIRILEVFPIDKIVINQAIDLRQNRNIGLADAVIASTALVCNLPLITRNIKDFAGINDLILHNPLS